jgi:hypothetical protein
MGGGLSQRAKVFFGVLFGLGVAGVPLMNKEIYAREQQVARMRDEAYDAKNMARDDRLRKRV